MMKLSSIAAVAVAFAATTVTSAEKPTWDALSADYTFEHFQKDFGKSYATAAEAAARRKIFEENRDAAVRHNKENSSSYRMNVNQFSDLTSEEFRGSHGWVSPRHRFGLQADGSDAVTFDELQIPHDFDLSSLPASIDWRTKGVVTPIKNQGSCGSCWAFASTESVESTVALDTQRRNGNATLIELSPQELVSCDTNPHHCGGTGGCQGSIAELAFDYAKHYGLASIADYPYTSGTTGQDGKCDTSVRPAAKVSGYTKLKENNYTQVMYALANVGPVAVNVDAMPMQSYDSGTFTGCGKDSTDIDHVVQLVGYGHDDEGTNYFILRNSWGTSWGMDGYMHLLRVGPDPDYCATDTRPEDGTGCTGGPSEVTTCGSCGVLYDVSYPTGGYVPTAK